MNLEGKDEESLRKYLLGELNEADQQAFEERLLADDELIELLLSEEDELVDEYVSGELSESERERFERDFLTTPERRRKLKFGEVWREHQRPVRDVDSEDSGQDPTTETLSTSSVTIKDSEEKDSEAKGPISSLPRAEYPPAPVVIDGPRSWWQRASSSPSFKAAAAAMIVLAVGVGSWRTYEHFRAQRASNGMLALMEAFPHERPTEARISEWNYAPPPPATRGPERDRFDYVALDRARALIQLEAKEHPSARSYHDLGRLYLADGDFDKAIDQFEKALRLDEKNAQVHSDLGATHLEKSKVDLSAADNSGKGFEELGKSLEHLNRALELDSSLREALFNRALVHQKLGLPAQAEEDWREYLEKDSASKWADEARVNLNRLEQRRNTTSQNREELLRGFLDAYEAHDDERAWRIISVSREALSRKLTWEQLLDAYLDASRKEHRNADARSKLHALAYAGNLELQRAGDHYTLGLAKFYGTLTAKQCDTLARARDLMKKGHGYYFQHSLDKAIEVYSRARQTFAQLGDQCEAQYAQHWIGYCYYEEGKTKLGSTILEEVAETARKQNYEWLLMRTLHLLSSAYHNLDEYSKAINYNHQALALAERIGDLIGIFNSSSILVFQYTSTGNTREALAHVQKSLSIIDDCPLNEIQFARHYTIVALAFSSAGLYSAAVEYQKEGLRRALAIGHIQHTSLDYARLGLMYGKMGDFSEALRGMALAYKTAESSTDETLRKEMMAFSSLQTGHLYREKGDWDKAISYYDASIELSDHFHFQYDVYEAHKNRLFCYLARGSDSLAQEELQTTLSLAEKYRSTIIEGENRNSFFDLEQSVYDLAIDFAYSRLNDPLKAFEYSEASRSRSLLDSVSGNAELSGETKEPDLKFKTVSQPLGLEQIRQRLPDNAQILQYAVLNDKVLAWVVSKTRFSTVEKKIAQRDLRKKVVDYVQALSAPSQDARKIAQSSARELFDILIRPVESLLDAGKPVYIVPDDVLNSLPFVALESPGGKFLFQDYLLEFSPSSSLLIICSDRASKKAKAKDERVLSVGNPRFSRTDFPTLGDLPAADREAEQIAGLYSSARLLTGQAATRDQLMSEMPKSDVMHLALHCVLDEKSTMRSRLVLAGGAATKREPASDGSIRAHEIYRLNLSRPRVAVLSACQTGAERYYRGEGMISMARPFMAAGVPLIVVSLWPVDSDSTAELMISFHRHRTRDDVSTAEALRRAQQEMLDKSDERLNRPFCWASFIAIGGSTDF